MVKATGRRKARAIKPSNWDVPECEKLTRHSLHKMLADERIVGRYNRPSRLACEKLAATVEGLRWMRKVGGYWQQHSNVDREKFKESLNETQAMVELLRRELQDHLASVKADWCSEGDCSMPQIEDTEEDLRALDQLLDGLSNVSKRPGLQPIDRTFVNPPATWHDCAAELERAFRKAMSSTNSGKLGIANDGPVAKFVAAMVKRVTGEDNLVLETVARHLQTKRKKAKRTVTPKR
jgi:hypothetical protein